MWWSRWNRKEPDRGRLPYLAAETQESQQALAGTELLLSVLPYRVGRESRQLSAIATTYLFSDDRRKSRGRSNNDLYLMEVGENRFISREHFLIDRDSGGRYFVRDRGSTLGTLVGDRTIGGNGRTGMAYIKPGDRIVPGGKRSPFVFRFEMREQQKFSLRVHLDRNEEESPPLSAAGSSKTGR